MSCQPDFKSPIVVGGETHQSSGYLSDLAEACGGASFLWIESPPYIETLGEVQALRAKLQALRPPVKLAIRTGAGLTRACVYEVSTLA